MKKTAIKLRLWLGIVILGLWLLTGVGLAQSLNNQVKIMQIKSQPGTPNQNEVYVSVLGPYPDHFAIEGLPGSAFALYEDETSLPLSGEPTAEKTGLAVVILIDRSGSMKEGGVEKPELRINSARNAAMALVDRLDPTTDLVGVIGFHTEINPTLMLTPDNGAARNLLYDDNQMSAEDNTKTALFSSLYQALDWLADNPDPVLRDQLQTKRKAIIAFTDGRDTAGGVTPADVRDRALANNIPIYTIGVDTGAWDTTILPELAAQFDDAEWIARTTDARFLKLSSPEERADLLRFFDGLVSQRNQYRLIYRSAAGEGAHTLRVEVTTTNAASQPMKAEDRYEFTGRLKLPEIQITNPPDGFTLDLGSSVTPTIPISIAVSFPDGLERPLKKVEYYVNGQLIGTVDTPPYTYNWDAGKIAGGNYTFIARAFDSALEKAGESVNQNQVTIKITAAPTPTPPPSSLPPLSPQKPFMERVLDWVKINWLTLLLLPVILVLFILLMTTRRQVAQGVRTVTSGATGLLKKGTTRLLGQGPAYAKLVITQGANPGREFRIEATAQMVSVGREREYCDFALGDDFASNPTFTIIQGAGPTFSIRDDNSKNGTWLNGQQLMPQHQYPLAYDSVIKAGNTLLTFKQIGKPTQQFPRPTQKVSP